MDEKQSQKREAMKELNEEFGEDTTAYGEFISSYFAWIGMDEQKEKVERLENITKKHGKNDKNEE